MEENKIPQEVVKALAEGMQKVDAELAKRPNQYVVVYKRKKDDSVIGYHASTFCQTTQDILKGKRYAGEPTGQLEIIWKNLTSTFKEKEPSENGLVYAFQEISQSIRETCFEGLELEDIYIDTVDIVDGTPYPERNVQIIENK